MANLLTCMRIVFALLMLPFPAFSAQYTVFYLLGGLTDAVDGTVARKLGQESEAGARLDTAADIVFAAAVIIKLSGAVYLPPWTVIWIGIIVLIKAVSIAAGFILCSRFVTVHSVLNKLCGAVIFTVLLFIGGDWAWQAKALGLIASCVLASAAAVSEMVSVIGKRGGDVKKQQ